MGKEIFSQCRLTVCERIKSKDSQLIEAVTQTGFEITSVSPLTIESNFTSKEDLLKLADVLTSSVEPQQCSSSAAISSNTPSLFSECQLTVSEEITSKDFELFEAVTEAGFKIIKVRPLVLKKDSTNKEDLVKLADLLTSDNVTGAGSSSNKGQKQQGDTFGSTTKKSTSVDKGNIPEPEVEDYVMKKHHFHLVGEYYFDRDWIELFGKAEETDEGFRFQMKDLSTDEYGMLQRLKKIAFETIGISDNEAHKVKEAAEFINCVDHGVCVIDYNSRPYIVGPKAQVYAAREEILYTLKEDGVDCHLTSLKTLATQNYSEDKQKNTDNSIVYDKANVEIDRESKSSSETESDTESTTVEYMMKKSDFRLAKQYFEGRPQHQHFDKAAKRGGGYLFSFSSKATDCMLFINTLRRLNFEAVSHRENDKPKVKSIADELKCGDLDVKVLEKGTTSFIVGPKEKVAEIKQKIASKLQETDKNGDDLAICEKPKRQGSRSDMRDDTNSSSRSSDGSARPKNYDGFRSSKDKDHDDSKFRGDYSWSLSSEGNSMERYGRAAEPGVYAGRCSDIKVLIHNTDITTLDVDCIVNASNTKLKHAGGVARVIARAAGRELQVACERFIDAGNTVPVTGVFVSPGGRLPAKHVLHAVGPKWDLYDESDKKRCTDDLRRTVLRCLVEAMRRGLSSIALPSISAAIFRVPKELCARSYLNAVKHFEEIVRKDMGHRDCTLKDIHFVDVDDTMVNYIRECFMNHWREPSDPDARQADEKVFQDQLKSAKSQPPLGPSQTSHRPSSPGGKPTRPRDVASSSVTGATAKSVERDTVYLVGELQLCISSRSALSMRSDLVITVGEEFDKLSGIPDYNVKSYKKPSEDVPKKKNCYTFSWIHKPDGKHRQLLCRLFPDPKSQSKLDSAFENLDPAIRLAALRGDKVEDVKTFVLTSSVLYAEPYNRKNAPSFIDRKLVRRFGNLVFDYVEKLSKESYCKVKQVVVTASEDMSVLLCKILETRPGIKNVSASVPGDYSHFRPRGQSPTRRGAGSYYSLSSVLPTYSSISQP